MSEILYFGWSYPSGHTLCSKQARYTFECTPWGSALDGGIEKTPDCVDGKVTVAYKDDAHGTWTALAFWDRSGDKRPGSHTVFLSFDRLEPEDMLRLSKEQWPEVFARPNFPTLLLPNNPKPAP